MSIEMVKKNIWPGLLKMFFKGLLRIRDAISEVLRLVGWMILDETGLKFFFGRWRMKRCDVFAWPKKYWKNKMLI